MIQFIRYRIIYFTFSAIVIGIGLISVITGGLKFSIDFTGGTNLEYKLSQSISLDKVSKIATDLKIEGISAKINKDVLSIRAKPVDDKVEQLFRTRLEKDLSIKVQILRIETVGPVLGRETMIKTGIASLIAIAGILLYLAFTFKSFAFASAAIVALVHDIFVVIGIYSLFSRFWGAEVDTLFVTALLTTMSFSVHDTIIIFDKVREYKRTRGQGDMGTYLDRALSENIVRSLNNSMTIVFMLMALTLLGGSSIRFFAATLLVGTLTGTYSSPFVATPVLYIISEKFRKR
ncbi:MAG: protein translocase subunit SecF [Candidatus Roizmanbacteria bacterium]